MNNDSYHRKEASRLSASAEDCPVLFNDFTSDFPATPVFAFLFNAGGDFDTGFDFFFDVWYSCRVSRNAKSCGGSPTVFDVCRLLCDFRLEDDLFAAGSFNRSFDSSP